MDTTQDHYKLETLLEKIGSEKTPEEAHGILIGLLCAQGSMDSEAWYTELMTQPLDSNNLLTSEATAELQLFKQQATTLLGSTDCDFEPLIMDDTAVLADRLESLGLWVQGFLLGLSIGKLPPLDKLPEDSAEIIQDMNDLTRLGGYEFDDSDDDENAFIEIAEYVRVGVLLINEELNPTKAPPQENATIH